METRTCLLPHPLLHPIGDLVYFHNTTYSILLLCHRMSLPPNTKVFTHLYLMLPFGSRRSPFIKLNSPWTPKKNQKWQNLSNRAVAQGEHRIALVLSFTVPHLRQTLLINHGVMEPGSSPRTLLNIEL